MEYFLVGIAGSLGAILRYLLGVALSDESKLFPIATLMINLTGSYLLAWLTTGLFKKVSLPPHIKTAIGTGFVGAFTTFSTLSVETVRLFQSNHHVLGMIYVFLSLVGGLVMSYLGFNGGKEGKLV